MNDDELAESLKLRADIFPDGRLLETRLKPGQGQDQVFAKTTENSIWKREKVLARGNADVFLYSSLKGELRVLKQIRWQEEIGNYRRELHMMERVSKEVEPHQKELFVELIGWFPSKDYIYFVLEYCPYGDISQQPTPMLEAKAWCVCNQIIEGLSVLHKLGIIHRDIKPENILVVDLNPIRVKIADFGISKLAHKDDTQPSTQKTTKIGTPGYMAPERLRLVGGVGSSHTPAVDLWSLGCLLHYILTGKIPFTDHLSDTNDANTVLEKYCNGDHSFLEKPLARYRVSLSGRCFVQRLLAPLPEDRPRASGQLMMDWKFPPATVNDVSLATEPFETSQLSITDTNHSVISQQQFHSDQPLLFNYSDSIITEPEMDLPSSELWYLLKSEKDGRLDRDRLRILLLSHANPNAYLRGYTALHIAAEQGSAETISVLLSYFADPEARTKLTQETALHLATAQGGPASVDKILQLVSVGKANPEARNPDGDTVLHLAIRRMGAAAIEILLEKGASTETKGRFGRTPLQYAIFLGREDLAMVLLNHEANPYCEDEDGLTPLHLAVKSNKLSISFMEILIGNGSRLNHEDNRRQTPLFVAATYGRRDFIRLLIDRGAECRPHSAELETRISKAQHRSQPGLRIPWLSSFGAK